LYENCIMEEDMAWLIVLTLMLYGHPILAVSLAFLLVSV
jgi:hypothetical protein